MLSDDRRKYYALIYRHMDQLHEALAEIHQSDDAAANLAKFLRETKTQEFNRKLAEAL